MKPEIRVVVTGMGVVAPNAHGLEDFAAALRQGKSGIRRIEKLQELNFACQVGGIPQNIDAKLDEYFSSDEQVAINEVITYSSIAAIDAFKDAGLKIPAMDEDFVYEDTGAIIGTGVGGTDTLSDKVYEKVEAGKVKRLGSTIVEQVMASAPSAKIGGKLALGNQVTTNSAACSTGTEAIIMGAERIRAGLAERMVCGGGEGSHHHIWAGFDSMRVLSRKFNDTPEAASRPMSASACGFVPGSGSGVMVVESLASAEKRGAKIYAEILGADISCGGMRFGGSMTAPSRKGVQRCVRTAILRSEIGPDEVDYINGHLTATFADPVELSNWATALELAPEKLPYINSTKSMIGHALGASGAIECIATVLQMHQGFVHGSINCEDLHPDITAYQDRIVRQSINFEPKIAAKASFGFGDVNSCIIFKKWEKSL